MIARERLSADVHQELLNQIIKGQLAPGLRLKDSELAEALGVSRTPVREALLRLEREGFISSQQHFGFSVKALEESEVREVYPLVKLLECSALSASPLPARERIRSLGECGKSLKKEGSDPLRRIELDSAWHETLIGSGGNSHQRRILIELKRIVFRYEYAFMENDDLVTASVSEHAGIVAALEEGDRKRAVRLLGSHWDRCAEATLRDFAASRSASKGAIAAVGAGV